MAAELTSLVVEHFKPGPQRIEVLDGRVPGLRLVVQPSGGKAWALRYKVAGRSRKLTLGRFPDVSLRMAREMAGQARNAIDDGRDPGAEKILARNAPAALPVHDIIENVVEKFLITHAPRRLKATTQHAVRLTLFREIVGPWRGRRLSEIARADVHDLLDKIVERGSPISANRALSWFRALCSWACARGIADLNPCDKVRQPIIEVSRERTLSDSELRAVWIACEALRPVFAAFIKTLVLTGLRRNEAAQMQWSEIDLNAKIFVLPALRSKNGREHALPLSDAVISILESCRQPDNPFVFALTPRNPIRNFYYIKKYVDAELPGMPEWHFHDLRRTFATGAARLGIQPHVVECALGHKGDEIKGVARAHNKYDYSAEQRSAFDVWARHVERVVAGVPASTNVVELGRRS